MKKEYQVIVDYVEGNISAARFHQMFLTDKKLKKILQKRMSKEYMFLSDYDYSLYNYLCNEYEFKNRNWDSISMRLSLQAELKRFLDYLKIPYTSYEKYHEEYSFVLSIQPSWLDIDDDSIFQKILAEIPENLSKTQRVKVGKDKIRQLFKYDKTYPRWIQDPEWPIVNGKPLVFSHQENVKGEDFHTYYYFYDEDTKEQTVVEQFS